MDARHGARIIAARRRKRSTRRNETGREPSARALYVEENRCARQPPRSLSFSFFSPLPRSGSACPRCRAAICSCDDGLGAACGCGCGAARACGAGWGCGGGATRACGAGCGCGGGATRACGSGAGCGCGVGTTRACGGGTFAAAGAACGAGVAACCGSRCRSWAARCPRCRVEARSPQMARSAPALVAPRRVIRATDGGGAAGVGVADGATASRSR